MNELEKWIEIADINTMYSSEYWNDIENEKTKAWWITDKNDLKLKSYLHETGLKQEFDFTTELVKERLYGNILDVAAGTCWTSALLSLYDNIKTIDALEFSLHRIESLAPLTIENLNGNVHKINRILGSFYDIKRKNEYYDAVLLSQAFHHAEYAGKLFHECDRVLKKGGTLIIIGELIITPWLKFKNIIKSFFRGKPSIDAFELFYNHDNPLGDHNYRKSDYQFLFFSYGYKMKIIKSKNTHSYILIGYKDEK